MSTGIDVKGREATLTLGGVTIPGVQTKSTGITNTRSETGDDSSAGYTEASARPNEKSCSFSFSGMLKNLGLMVAAGTAPTVSQVYAIVLTYSDGTVVAGNFFLDSYTDTGKYNEAYTFDVSMSSSGAFTVTAGS